MVKDTPRANKRNKQDNPSPEITPATSTKRSKRRNSQEKQSAYRVMKRDAKRDKRAKKDGSLNKEASHNTDVLNKKDADDDDDDDDDKDDKDDPIWKQSPSPAVTPHETPDIKRKLQPELETPKQQPIPVYDAATEARKAELYKAAKT